MKSDRRTSNVFSMFQQQDEIADQKTENNNNQIVLKQNGVQSLSSSNQTNQYRSNQTNQYRSNQSREIYIKKQIEPDVHQEKNNQEKQKQRNSRQQNQKMRYVYELKSESTESQNQKNQQFNEGEDLFSQNDLVKSKNECTSPAKNNYQKYQQRNTQQAVYILKQESNAFSNTQIIQSIESDCDAKQNNNQIVISKESSFVQPQIKIDSNEQKIQTDLSQISKNTPPIQDISYENNFIPPQNIDFTKMQQTKFTFVNQIVENNQLQDVQKNNLQQNQLESQKDQNFLPQAENLQEKVEMGEQNKNRIQRFLEEQSDLRKTLEDFKATLYFFAKKMNQCLKRFSHMEHENEQLKKKVQKEKIVLNTFFSIPADQVKDYKQFQKSTERLLAKVEQLKISIDTHFEKIQNENNNSVNLCNNQETQLVLQQIMEFIFDFINNLIREELQTFQFIKNDNSKDPRCRFDKEIFLYLKDFMPRYRIIMQIFINQTKTMGRTQELRQQIEKSEENDNIEVVCSKDLENYQIKIYPLDFALSYRLDNVIGSYQDKRGQGSSGKVVKIPSDPENELVLKITDAINEADYRQNLNEILIHSYINSKDTRNIIQLLDTQILRNYSQDDEQYVQLFIKMEYAQCSLAEAINFAKEKGKNFNECDVLIICLQLLQGLEDLHTSCKIAHRDIKPSNILFSKKRRCWVYADFGVSQLFGRQGVSNDFDEHTIAGTALYMCPEQLHQDVFLDFETAIQNVKPRFSLMRNDRYALGLTILNILDLKDFESRIFENHKAQKEQDWRRLREIHSLKYPLSSEIALKLLEGDLDPFPYEQYYKKIKRMIGSENQQPINRIKQLIKRIEDEKLTKFLLLDRFWMRHMQYENMLYNAEYKQEAKLRLSELFQEIIDKEGEIVKQLSGSKIIDYFSLVIKLMYEVNPKDLTIVQENILILNQYSEKFELIYQYLKFSQIQTQQKLNIGNEKNINQSEERNLQMFYARECAKLAKKLSQIQNQRVSKIQARTVQTQALQGLTLMRSKNLLKEREYCDNVYMAKVYRNLCTVSSHSQDIKEWIQTFNEYRNSVLRQNSSQTILLLRDEADLLIKIEKKIKELKIREIPTEATHLLIDLCQKALYIPEDQQKNLEELPNLIGIEKIQKESLGVLRMQISKSHTNHELAQVILLWLAARKLQQVEDLYVGHAKETEQYVRIIQKLIESQFNLARRIESYYDQVSNSSQNTSQKKKTDSKINELKFDLEKYVGDINVYTTLKASSQYILKALQLKSNIQSQMSRKVNLIYSNCLVYWGYMSLQDWKLNHCAPKNIPIVLDLVLRHFNNKKIFEKVFYWLRKVSDNLENQWNSGSYQLREFHDFYMSLIKIFEKYSNLLPKIQIEKYDEIQRQHFQNKNKKRLKLNIERSFTFPNSTDRDKLRAINIEAEFFQLSQDDQKTDMQGHLTSNQIYHFFNYLTRLELKTSEKNTKDNATNNKLFIDEIFTGLVKIKKKQKQYQAQIEKQNQLREQEDSKQQVIEQIQELKQYILDYPEQQNKLKEQKAKLEEELQKISNPDSVYFRENDEQQMLTEQKLFKLQNSLEKMYLDLGKNLQLQQFDQVQEVLNQMQSKANQSQEIKNLLKKQTQDDIVYKNNIKLQLDKLNHEIQKNQTDFEQTQIQLQKLEKELEEFEKQKENEPEQMTEQNKISENQYLQSEYIYNWHDSTISIQKGDI